MIALTGFPVGLNWQEYMKETGRSYHPIHVHIVRSGKEAKLRKLRELLNPNKRTMIFCGFDRTGQRNRTHVRCAVHSWGNAKPIGYDSGNKVIAMSRVGDVGVSVKDLEQIIEVDFLYGRASNNYSALGA